MKDETKLLSLLGLCRRAGRLACGHDAAMGAIKNRSACLCFLSSDASERLRRETEREVQNGENAVSLIQLAATMDEIGHATGLRSAVLTVNDNGFAQSMRKLLENAD